MYLQSGDVRSGRYARIAIPLIITLGIEETMLGEKSIPDWTNEGVFLPKSVCMSRSKRILRGW